MFSATYVSDMSEENMYTEGFFFHKIFEQMCEEKDVQVIFVGGRTVIKSSWTETLLNSEKIVI